MNEQPHWKTNPKGVSALEYAHCILRAEHEAGLMIDRSHIYTVREKLLQESNLPKIRLLQILNQLSDAATQGKETIELPIADVRIILQLGKSLNENSA